jgi:hypothetical protein
VDDARPKSTFIGHGLNVTDGGPDGIAPRVFLGEYSSIGLLSNLPTLQTINTNKL